MTWIMPKSLSSLLLYRLWQVRPHKQVKAIRKTLCYRNSKEALANSAFSFGLFFFCFFGSSVNLFQHHIFLLLNVTSFQISDFFPLPSIQTSLIDQCGFLHDYFICTQICTRSYYAINSHKTTGSTDCLCSLETLWLLQPLCLCIFSAPTAWGVGICSSPKCGRTN